MIPSPNTTGPTPQQMLHTIRDKCVKANPEIETRWRFCVC